MTEAIGKKIIWICIVPLIAVLSWSIAWADFYVVASGKRAKKTILVRPESTETASGTALLNAMNGITDAGVTNPYLIIIEPGIYDIEESSLQMKEYVDILGSGENVTKISGNTSSFPSGVLMGADNAEVRFLTVENTGGGSCAFAICNSSVSPVITNVKAISSGGINNYGVYNNYSSPKMTNVTVTASGGNYSFGVSNSYSSPTMTNVTAIGSGGSNSSRGIYNGSSSPIMKNVTATASGSGENIGVFNSYSSPTMKNVIATASGGINVLGVYNGNASSGTIDHSVLSGDDAALYNSASGATTYIGNTRLNGGVGGGSAWTKCAGVYDGDFAFYADTCP